MSDPKLISKKIRTPLYKNHDFISCESGSGFHEFVMSPRKIDDRKPVQVGLAILQYSKLLLLEFVLFLKTYLIEGSYALVYSDFGLKLSVI